MVDLRIGNPAGRQRVRQTDARKSGEFLELPSEHRQLPRKVDGSAERLLREERRGVCGGRISDVAVSEELVLRGEELEAQADGAAHQVWLREPERRALRPVPARNRDDQRFAVAQQVVRRILQPEEAPRVARHAAVELDLLPPLLLDLQVDVHRLVTVVGPRDRVLLLDLIEQPQLVQPQHREVPVALVVGVPLVEQHLTAHHHVARVRVPYELQPMQRELPPLLDFQRDLDLALLRRLVDELRDEIDVGLDEALRPVEVLDPLVDVLRYLLGVHPFAHFHARVGRDYARLEQGHALLLDLGNPVAPPDLYRHADLQPGTGLAEQRQRQPAPHLPCLLHVRLAELRLQIALRPEEVFHPLQVVQQLVFEVDVLRREVREQARVLDQLHRPAQPPLRETVAIAHELDLLDADSLAFVHVEDQTHRGGRNILHLDRDLRVRMPLLGQQLTQDQPGAVDFRGVEIRLLADIDGLFFEPGQDLALGGRLQAEVIYGADDRVFLDLEDDDLAAAGPVLDEELGRQWVEQPHLNDGLQIALGQAQVETVLRLALDVIKDRFPRDAAVAADLYLFDEGFRRLGTLRQGGPNRTEGNYRNNDCACQKENASGHESSPIEQC